MPFLAAIPAVAWLAAGTVGAGLLAYAGASKAAGATKEAAGVAKEAAVANINVQKESLEYLKEREALPQELREKALTKLGGIYGLPGMEAEGIKETALPPGMVSPYEDREGFMAGLTEDPFYETAVAEGEESVLRGMSATGGLRSGGASVALAKVAPDILKNLYGQRYGEYQDYIAAQERGQERELSGLRGIAGLPSGAPQISQTMKGIGQTMESIGQTEARGISDVGQMWQRGFQNIGDIMLSGLGTGIKEGLI